MYVTFIYDAGSYLLIYIKLAYMTLTYISKQWINKKLRDSFKCQIATINFRFTFQIKIKDAHFAVVNDDMDMLQTKVDQPELLSAKDQNGLNALHKV